MISLALAYSAAVQRGDIHDDPEQRRLLASFQSLTNHLKSRQAWYRFLWPKKWIKGLYVTGPVGIGKTYMMDLFYQNLPDKHKLRVHFLHFMQQIDQKLRFLQGKTDPVLKVAAELAKQYHVICIDEFIVDDIAHAMIVGELFQALFAMHVVLVATSNTKINDLYRDGLNREAFLPTIALLHQYCDEIDLESSIDYRLGKSLHLHAYIFPLDDKCDQLFLQQFQSLASTSGRSDPISVQSRFISVVKVSESVVWFEFAMICDMPRCQLDYIELAERYHTIFVSDIPKLGEVSTNTPVVLFIQLVDVLYDRGIRLIISAAVSAQELYQSGPMLPQFARTLSRLEEMQSEDYLNRHCPMKDKNT